MPRPGHRNYFDDDDADHLPSGMKRIGYDTDTGRYMFRQGNSLWLGEPGSLYGGKMKRAGQARASTSVDSRPTSEGDGGGDEDEEDKYPETSDPVPPYLENDPSPEILPTPSTSRLEGDGEWGVPVHSISDTHAKPPDTNAGAALKRRASRFKEAASSTIVASRVVRRLTTRKRPSRAVPQQDSGMTDEREENEVRRARENTSGTDGGIQD